MHEIFGYETKLNEKAIFFHSISLEGSKHSVFADRERESFSHLSSLTLTEQSSGIFSSELLQVDNLSRSSSMSLKRSATHCAVSRASGSWSQHSLMVAQTVATPWRQNTSVCGCICLKTVFYFSPFLSFDENAL